VQLKSKYKTLVVSGCSFTENRDESAHTWSNVLANWCNMEIVNLAVAGAGNSYISTSLIYYLETNNLDPESTLVLAMWSCYDRIDFVVDPTKFVNRQNQRKMYNEKLEHFMAGGLKWGPNDVMTTKYKSLQSQHTLALQNWLDFSNLTNYLNSKRYQHRFTATHDVLYGQGADPIGLLELLKSINLELDTSNWVCIDKKDKIATLEEFATYYDQRIPDDLHPTRVGHEMWLEQKLVPELIKHNIVCLN